MTQPTLFGDDPEPVARARTGDPETSHAAAASLGGDVLRRSQAEVLVVLGQHGPCTDLALVEFYEAVVAVGQQLNGTPIAPQSPSGVRTRRRELQTLGRVRDSGSRVKLPSGRLAVVWEVVQ